MGNEGLPISLVIFVVMVLVTAIVFVGAISIAVLMS
jgi:hypothetical protein